VKDSSPSKHKENPELNKILSEAERRFERIRRRSGLFLGPLIFLVLYFLPLRGLSPAAHALAAVIAWVITWWITEPIPLAATALFGTVLCVLLAVGDVKTAFAPFADPIIFLFLGSFMIARAMTAHGLDKRFAYKMMSQRWVGNSTGRILFAFGAASAFISMWISNTATTAMLFPIGLGIISAMAEMISAESGKTVTPERLRLGTGMMLMAAYASSIGGVGTPVGTPPNLIGIAMMERFAGVKIPFFKWMLFAVPLLLVMFLLAYGLLFFLHKPEVAELEGGQAFVRKELARLGRWTRGEKNAFLAFLVAVILWVMPGFLVLFLGKDSPASRFYNSRFPEAAAAIIAAVLLFLLPVDRERRRYTLSWKQAVEIDWGTLLLFGGGLSLGNLMFETKLAEALSTGILHLFGATSLWTLTLVGIYLAILASETTSNTAAATMLVPIIISLAAAFGVNPIPPAIGTTLGCSWAFMLPVSTPPNAIVYGSGLVPITKMIRGGVLLSLSGGLVIWLMLRLLLPLVGLA
jgi:sodium-dependent dicarboxylate transporter 2/3/5